LLHAVPFVLTSIVWHPPSTLHPSFQLVNKITPEELMEHLEFTVGLLRSIVSDAKHRKGSVMVGSTFLLAGEWRAP
jgi:hypothetical protein